MKGLELDESRLKRRQKSEYERTRDKHIKENLWKASQAARKVATFSGVPFEELRSVAMEAMVKLYDKWDPERANFSTWLNRSLTFQLLNWLRDNSRVVKIPRTYADAYMKIRHHLSRDPDISDKDISEATGIKEAVVTETRRAFQITYQDLNEDTEIPYEDKYGDTDNLASLFDDYKETLKRLADLPESEYNFLMDVYVHKRANSTIFRKNSGVNTSEKIREKTQEILSKVLEDVWPQDT